MSDGLGYQQADVRSGIGDMPPAYLGDATVGERAGRPTRLEVTPGELQLRRLTWPWEIDEVAHLRRQIQLPAAVLADPGFAELEKKETGSALSLHSGAAT